MVIEGDNTPLVHTSEITNPSTELKIVKDNVASVQHSDVLFILTNTSLALQSLVISAPNCGSIAQIDTSQLKLMNSEIVSNTLSSPFYVLSASGTLDVDIQFISCQHRSSQPGLLNPFVWLQCTKTDSISPSQASNLLNTDVQGHLSIAGLGLEFSTQLFLGRSGPLLLLPEMDPQNREEGSSSLDGASLRTTLISSTLSNVTSSTPFHPRLAPSPVCLSQTILGCSISHSADHLSGTTIRDMNLGGSLLCTNSSFAHCTVTAGQNYTQDDRIAYASSSVTSLTFSFCTFRHMTMTTTAHLGGAALSVYNTQATLTVSDSSFLNCTATGTDVDGGAVCYYGGAPSGTPQYKSISLTRNSFVSCSTTDGGGAVMVYYYASPTVSACSFHKNSAGRGGCFAVQNVTQIIAINCSLSQNTAKCGGGIAILYAIPFTLTDLAFRENTATDRTHSTDYYFQYADNNAFPTSSYTRCDSSSSHPNGYFEEVKVSSSKYIPLIDTVFTVSGFSVSHSETTTIVINTTAAVKGVMSVLISGGLVPRLAFVTFSSTGSTSGTGTTTTSVLPSETRYWPEITTILAYKLEESIFIADSSLTDSNTAQIVLNGLKLTAGSYSMLVKDPTGTQTNITLSFSNSTTLTASATLYPIGTAKLKYGTTYTIKKVSRGTTSIVVTSDLSFKIPDEPTRIVGIWGELDTSGNTTKIVVRGRQIPQGTYTLKLDSSSGPSFEVSFSDAVSEERNSSIASVSIFGDQPVLSFNTTYSIFSLTSTLTPFTSILIDANPNSFRITEPSRITNVTMGALTGALKDSATLSMTGRALTPNTDYKMHLTGLPKTSSSTATNTEADIRTVTMRTESSVPSQSVSKVVEFYPHSSADLLFGYEYSVDSVSLGGSTLVQNSGLSFFTPDEPARLSSIESCSLTASKDGVIVIVKGFALKQDTIKMIVTSSDGREIESDGKIEVKTSSECWIRFKTSWEESTTHLEFLKTYTLNIGKGGSNELIITPDLSFTLPSGPIVASISAPLTCSSSSFAVEIVGTDLPIESGFTVELVGGLSFLVDFDSATTGNGTISASLPGQIQFNTDYSVKSVTKGDRKMKCDSVSFMTPLGPTLVDVKAALNTSNINNVIVTLESVRMPVGEMTLTVQEDSTTAIPLTVSFVSSEVGSVEVVVFGGSSLKYGTTYKVVSLTSSSLHSSLDGTITFKTPATPPRIKTASCSLVGEWKRDGEVVLTGEAFPAGTPFSISVDEIDETGVVIPGSTPIILSDRFGGVIGDAALTTHTLSIPLFPVPKLMKYSRRCRITSLSISTVPTAVEQTATFKVPTEPARVVGIWGSLSVSGNSTNIVVRGRQIPQGTYTLKLDSSSGPSFEVSFSDAVSEERDSSIASVSIFGDQPVLSFNTTYSIFSLISTLSPFTSILIDANPNSFVVSEPSRITSVTIGALTGALKDSATLSMTGHALQTNTIYSLCVKGTNRSNSSETHNTTLSITSASSTPSASGSASITLYPINVGILRFGYSYSVTSVAQGVTPILLNSGVSFTTPDEPARIVGIWGELDTSGNTTKIVVRGRQIPQGTYTLKLDSSTGPSFEVSFSDAVSEERNSSIASVSIFGDQPVLSFNTTYSIFSLTSTLSPLTSILIDASPNSFRITEPSRITSVAIGSLSATMKTEAMLTMTGRALEAETSYTFQLKGLPKSTSSTTNADPHFKTLSITSSSTSPYDVGSLPVVLYPSDSADLLFGYTYTVQSVTLDGTPLLLNSGLSFTTPDEPARISSIKTVSLASSKNAIVLTLAGFALKQDSISIIVKSSTANTISSDGVVSVTSPTECTITFRANWVENNTHLQFLKEYTLSGSSGGSELLIDENLSFSAPTGSIVTSLTAPAECTSSSFVVAVAGTDLPIKSDVTLELVGGLSFTVDFNSSTTGQGSIQASLLDQIQFSTKYAVSSVTKDEMIVKSDGVTLQTPLGPTLTNVSSALDASNINNVVLTLTSLRMPRETFTLTVCEDGSSVQILLPVTFSSQIEGKSVVVVHGGTTLKYGTAYTVISLTSSTLRCSLNEPITFTTPPAPPRIHTASCELVAPSKRSGEITLVGDAFPAGEDFSISLIEIDEHDDTVFGSSSITLHSTFDGDSGGPALSSQNLTVLLSPLPQQLKYSSRYRVTAFSIPDVLCAVEDTAIIDIPAEPIRLEDLQPLLASSLETVSVTLIGRRFDIGTFTANLQIQSPSQGAQFDIGCERVSDTQLVLTLPISTADASSVKFGDVVSVVSLKNGSMAAIQHCSSFTVPHPPRVDTATFSFSTDTNTSFELTLDGTDLHPDTVCSVLLDSNHSFEIVILNSSTGVSTEMALGWPDTLQYSTKYRIVSIKNKDTDGVVFVGDSLTFTTEKNPRRIIVFCDSASTDSSRLCGCEDRPCSSMDSAWRTAMNVEAKDISIRINLNATLSSPVICLSQGILVIEKGTSTEPKLFVPSSATMGEKGLIEITSGLIEFRDVDVIVESLLSSFVLLFASDCSVVLKDGSIVGKALPSNSPVDELVCEWETGVLQLSHCTTDITETVLSHLPQGAVSMKGGKLTIISSTFFDNSPDLESFPSVRQNVRCVEEGVVEVGSLHGGDGTGDHPSAWISATNCKVGGAEAKQESSFFIPTLSSASSKSTFNKKEQTFTVRIEGKTLIPCGLFLEVFEVGKDKKEGKALLLPLSLDSTASFTETTVSLVVPQMSISSLSSSLELRGRLSFGEAKTSESFVVRMSSSDKMAQSFVNSMKWWIPLVAGILVTISLVIILVLCWRRRQKKKNEADQTPKAELQEIDIEKMEMPDNDILVHKTSARVVTTAGMERAETSTLNPSSSTQNRTAQADGQTVVRCSETVDVRVVRQTHTLYQRLHPNTIQFHTKFGLQHRIVVGLSQLLKTKPHSTILTHLSPYAYLFDGEENLFLKADAEKRTGETADKQDPQQPLEMHQHLANIEQKIREEEGLRWEAPEMEFSGKEHNAHKAAVFSLGLILWEVETGIVPFVEYDALNAQRQVRMGVKPPTQQIEDRKMRELILECLELNPQDRPLISTILEAFVEMEKEKKQENQPAPKEQTLQTGTAGPVVDLLVFNP